MRERETTENEAKNQEEAPEPVLEIGDLEAAATEDVKGGTFWYHPHKHGSA
jgi:hypothetical protein